MTQNNSTQPRVKPGVPTGGRWMSNPNDADNLDLAADAAAQLSGDALAAAAYETEQLDESDLYTEPAKRYKPNNIGVGSRTPWGEADYHVNLAPGIDRVSTPGHGGIKLSADRNKEVHPAWRQKGGWYEEDCEWAIAAFTWPHETRPRKATGYTRNFSYEEHVEHVHETLRSYYPDQWEQITGETIPFGVSARKDENEFKRNHAGSFLMTSALTLDDGRIQVTAAKESTGEKALFYITKEEYDRAREETKALRGGYNFVVNETTAIRGAHPDELKVPTKKYTTVPSTDGATPAARERIEKDLNQPWRRADGGVRTLRQMIESGEVSGKSAVADGTGYKYSLKLQANEGESYSVVHVSKATWDAFEGPDDRSDYRKALDAHALARNKFVKEFGNVQEHRLTDRDQKRYRKIKAEVEAARAAEKAAYDDMAG